MKTSSKFIIMFLLTTIWCLATLYATNTLEILPFDGIIERYMVLTPFVALIGILIIWAIERKPNNNI